MKDIKRTDDGQYLVSMSEDEHNTFAGLEAAIMAVGSMHRTIRFGGEYKLKGMVDLSGAFKAMMLFTMITDLNNIFLHPAKRSDK